MNKDSRQNRYESPFDRIEKPVFRPGMYEGITPEQAQSQVGTQSYDLTKPMLHEDYDYGPMTHENRKVTSHEKTATSASPPSPASE